MLSVAEMSYKLFKDGVKPGGTIVIDPNLVHPTDEDRKTWNILRDDEHSSYDPFGNLCGEILHL